MALLLLENFYKEVKYRKRERGWKGKIHKEMKLILNFVYTFTYERQNV